MRELDRMLERFLEQAYSDLDPAEKARFEEFLEFPDPDLHAYLLGKAEPMDPDLARLLRHIRATLSAQA